MHETAAQVATLLHARPHGTILPSVRIVRPESEAISFAENSSGITASNDSRSALIRFNASHFHQQAVSQRGDKYNHKRDSRAYISDR